MVHWKCTPGVRRPSVRRELTVERFTDKEIQVLKALVTVIQAQVDINWDSSPEWTGRSIWTNLLSRLRQESGPICNTLPKRILRRRPVRSVQKDSKGGGVGKGRGSDKSTGVSTKRKRLSRNARVGTYDDPYHAASYGEKDLRRSRK